MTVNHEDESRRSQQAPAQTDHFGGPARHLSGLRAALGPVVLLVLILAVSYGVAHHTGASQRYLGSSDTPSTAGFVTKSKPSAWIPFAPKRQAAAQPEVASATAEAVGSAVSMPAVEAATTDTPVRPLKPRETEGAFAAKHQKSFGRGCDGQLALTAQGLDFRCESGSEPDLHLAAAEIRGANGNGVELKTGEKYHFDLQRSKSEELEIFRNWASTHLGDSSR